MIVRFWNDLDDAQTFQQVASGIGKAVKKLTRSKQPDVAHQQRNGAQRDDDRSEAAESGHEIADGRIGGLRGRSGHFSLGHGQSPPPGTFQLLVEAQLPCGRPCRRFHLRTSGRETVATSRHRQLSLTGKQVQGETAAVPRFYVNEAVVMEPMMVVETARARYQGMLGTMMTIAREEGPRYVDRHRFYRVLPSCCRRGSVGRPVGLDDAARRRIRPHGSLTWDKKAKTSVVLI